MNSPLPKLDFPGNGSFSSVRHPKQFEAGGLASWAEVSSDWDESLSRWHFLLFVFFLAGLDCPLGLSILSIVGEYLLTGFLVLFIRPWGGGLGLRSWGGGLGLDLANCSGSFALSALDCGVGFKMRPQNPPCNLLCGLLAGADSGRIGSDFAGPSGVST